MYLNADGSALITTYDADDANGVHHPGLTRIWQRIGAVWSLWQTIDIDGEATMSADGNTLLFSRTGAVYTRQTRGLFKKQLDLKPDFEGVSAAISADGTTAFIGKAKDKSLVVGSTPAYTGAFYVFSATPPSVIPGTLAPTIASSQYTFDITPFRGGTLYWAPGNGNARSVFIKAVATGSPKPADGYLYAASNPYTENNPIHQDGDNDDWYCVYTGTGDHFDIDGLAPLTTYRVAVVDFNGGYAETPTAYIKNFNVSDFTTPIASPTGNAQYFEFSNTTATTSTLNWSRADGAAVAVFVGIPGIYGCRYTQNVGYTANTTFGLGSPSEYPGWYCVYNGTGTTVNITGLQASTYYTAIVVEYNGGPGQERYAQFSTGTEVTTPAAPVTLLTTNQKRMLVEQDVLEEPGVEVNVHQALSPNGDGVNDVFTIDGIGAYPENTVKVLNSNGEAIYSATGYNNYSKAFDGHAANGTLQKAGTYFYTLEYKKGKETVRKTGYLVLKY